MANKNNPAGRLYILLEQAANIGDGVRTEDVWRQIFQIPPGDSTALWQSILELHKLYKDTIQNLQSVENLNSAIYIEPLSSIENAIYPRSLDMEWRSFRTSLTEKAMTTLRICDDILSKGSDEVSINEDGLNEIFDDVQSLINDILQGSLRKDIKEFLIRQLENIRQAIINYKISGSFSLQKALQDTLGAIMINLEKFEQVKDSEEGKAFAKIWEKLSRIVKPTYNTAKFVYQERNTFIAIATSVYNWFFSSTGAPTPIALPPSPQSQLPPS